MLKKFNRLKHIRYIYNIRTSISIQWAEQLLQTYLITEFIVSGTTKYNPNVVYQRIHI